MKNNRYQYAMVMRPPMMGALPNKGFRCILVEHECRKYNSKLNMFIWAIVEYDRELEQHELEAYEMVKFDGYDS